MSSRRPPMSNFRLLEDDEEDRLEALGLVSVVAIATLKLIGTDVKGVLDVVEAALAGVPGA